MNFQTQSSSNNDDTVNSDEPEFEKKCSKLVNKPKAELRQSFSKCVYCMRLRFKVITLVVSSQRNFFENATTYSKRTLKTTVATQLN